VIVSDPKLAVENIKVNMPSGASLCLSPNE
jgi:hypothetical protein